MKKFITILFVSVVVTALTYLVPHKSKSFSCSDVVSSIGKYSSCQNTIRGYPFAYWYSDIQGSFHLVEGYLKKPTTVAIYFSIDTAIYTVIISFAYLIYYLLKRRNGRK